MVPNSPPNLLVPSSVAGATLGYRANRAGIWMSPPPPTISSMSQAANAAISTNNRSNDNSTPEGYLQVGRQEEPEIQLPKFSCSELSIRLLPLGNPGVFARVISGFRLL